MAKTKAPIDIDDHEAVKRHLDNMIVMWRKRRDKALEESNTRGYLIASSYVDAHQSMRANLFGACLAPEITEREQIVY